MKIILCAFLALCSGHAMATTFDADTIGHAPSGWTSLDGKRYIDFDDSHISGPGAVGVWTKADSVTAFNDFNFGITRP